MARMVPAHFPAERAQGELATAERTLYRALQNALSDEWYVVHDCLVRAGGEEGRIDFVLLHERLGIALVALAEEGVEIAADEAIGAVQAMLGEIGFTQRFPGRMPVVALGVDARNTRGLRQRIEIEFLESEPLSVADPEWVEWLSGYLSGRRGGNGAGHAGEPVPAADLWKLTVDTGEPTGAIPRFSVAPEGALPLSAAAEPASPHMWLGIVLAIAVVAVLLLAMAVLSHGRELLLVALG